MWTVNLAEGLLGFENVINSSAKTGGGQFRSQLINRAAYQALAIQLATDSQCQSAPVDQPSTTHFIFNTVW